MELFHHRNKTFVHSYAVLGQHLIQKTTARLGLQCVHILVFVVPTVNQDATWLRQEVGKQQAENFHSSVPAVSDITVEEIDIVLRIGNKSGLLIDGIHF